MTRVIRNNILGVSLTTVVGVTKVRCVYLLYHSECIKFLCGHTSVAETW